VLVAGCGFSPVYGPAGGAVGRLQGQVGLDAPSNRAGFDLAARLEERLGRPAGAPAYVLTVNLDTDSEGLGITTTNEIDRYNIVGRAGYGLRDAATGVLVTAGRVETFASYSTTGSTLSARAARRDAQRRLSRALADLVVTRLLVELGDPAP